MVESSKAKSRKERNDRPQSHSNKWYSFSSAETARIKGKKDELERLKIEEEEEKKWNKEQEIKFAPVDKNDSRKLAKQREAEEKEQRAK